MADPFSSFGQGFVQARQLRQQQGSEPTELELLQAQIKRDQDLQLQRGRIDIQQLQLQGQEAKTAGLEIQAQQQRATQDLIGTLPLKPTGEQLRAVAFQLSPDDAKTLIDNNANISDVVHQNTIARVGPVVAALQSGQTGIALNDMDAQIEAFQNGGDTERADNWQFLRDQAASGPEGARGVAEFFTARMAFTPGGDTVIDNINNIAQERRKEQLQPAAVSKAKSIALVQKLIAANKPDKLAADLGLTLAQTDKLKAATKLGKDEARRVAQGIFTPAQKIDFADDRRKEYLTHSKVFLAQQNAIDTVRTAEDTGIGQVGLIFALMKTFDPGSVVRESEFQVAAGPGGITQSFLNLANQAIQGKVLGDEAGGQRPDDIEETDAGDGDDCPAIGQA